MRCGSVGGWSNYSRSGFRLANRDKMYASSQLGFRLNGVWKSGWVSYASSYHRVEYRRATNTVLSNGNNSLGFRLCEWWSKGGYK